MARRRRGSTNARTGRKQSVKGKADSCEGNDPAEKLDDSVAEEIQDVPVESENMIRRGRRGSNIKFDEVGDNEVSKSSEDRCVESVHIKSLLEDPGGSSVQLDSQDMLTEDFDEYTSLVTNENKGSVEDSEDCISNDYFEDESKIQSVDNSEILMPQDIQQIVLGDLKGVTVGQGDEIIVSHEEEIVWEEGVVEEVICEDGIEIEMDTQDLASASEEEEEKNNQVVVIKENLNSQDGQFLVVVNDSDNNDVVTNEDNDDDDDNNSDIVGNGDDNVSNSDDQNDVQEGSCEIITVVKESDNENSQDSGSLNCDTINAVIGSGENMIQNVTISEYHSDDDNIITNENRSEQEDSSSSFSSLHKDYCYLFSDYQNQDIEMNKEDKCSSVGEDVVIEKPNSKESFVAEEEMNDSLQSVKLSSSPDVYNNDNVVDDDSSSRWKPQSTSDSTMCSAVVESDSVDEQQSMHVVDEQCDATVEPAETKSAILKQEDISISSTSEKEDGTVDNESEDCGKLNQVLCSRSSVTESRSSSTKTPCDSTVDETCTVKRNKISDIFDGQEVSSSHPDTANSEKCVNEFSVFKTLTSSQKYEKNCESNEQNVLVKERTDDIPVPDEEKQPIFRSRSGSTDTTGSESGSNSSSGRRRSSRLRSIGMMKQQSESESSKTAVQKEPSATGTAVPPVPGYEGDKPVKVKSRWRRSSELEMGNRRCTEMEVGSTKTDSDNAPTPPCSFQPSTPPSSPPPAADDANDKEMEEKLRNFQHIPANEYLTERSKSKDAKRMVCDCVLTKEEISRGEMGCGEDCLNRLLMIECGARCMLGEKCANKRFQNLEYAKCEVFKTEKKGFGLRAVESIPVGTFLLEYVGEVLDPKEFRRRAKDYAKDKNLHYYFMALKSDAIIDATMKGNLSRFINHSCDPNSETQKWTVNGELRIGFFSTRVISPGEEITFDYQFQRYGKEAQRCYCETPICRGWIGEDPDKEGKWSDMSSRKERREKERKKKEERKRDVKDLLNDMDLEEEIEKLVASGLKNRAHTLTLCRLMVRAEDSASRSQLLKLLQSGDTACLRLFLDYHGLRLIWSWMMDSSTRTELRIEIMQTLAKLPIPNKTMLQDSKVLNVIEKWSSRAGNLTDSKDSSPEEDSDKGKDSDCAEKQENKQNNNDSQNMGSKGSDDSEDIKDTTIDNSTTDSTTTALTNEVKDSDLTKCVELATNLLSEWLSLKEVFRIPKKERIEQMKEHEREADRGYKENLEPDDQRDKQSYDRHWSHDRYRSDYDKRDRDKDRDRKRGRDSPDQDRYRKNRSDDRNGPPQPKMSKNERRQLFEMKVAQEEEEERQRRQQEELWQQQQEQCLQQLSMETANYSAHNGFPCYFDRASQTWLPYPTDPNMMQPQPGLDMRPPDIGSNPVYPPNPNNQPFMFNQNHHPPFVDPNQPPPTFQHPGGPPPVFNHPPPNMQNPQMPPKPALLPTPPIMPKPPHLANPPNLPHQTPPQCFTPDQQPFQPPLPPNPQFVQPPPQFQPPLPSNPQNNPLPTFQPPLPQTTISQSPTSTTPQFQPPLPKNPQFPQSTYQSPQPTTVAYTETTHPPPAVPLYIPTPVRLPPKWKSAKDSEGRVYYYHVKKRVSQWEPPVWEQPHPHESESSSESSESEEEEESSEEEEEEEEEEIEKGEDEEEEDREVEEEEEEEEDEVEVMDVNEFRSDLIEEPEPMTLMEDTTTDEKRRRRENLVQERIISPRLESEKLSDKKHYLEVREQIKRQKAKQKEKMRSKKARSRSKTKSRSGTSQCEADTSSDPVRRIKDTFRLNMAGVIVHYLNPYRKPDCKIGRITNTEDFKHLARKLTHFVMLKELKHCRSVEDLECNDNVKHKARDFIKKYMAKFGPVYQRPSDDD